MDIILGEVLIAIKERKSLSIKKISSDSGIPQSVLHGWINGTIPSAKNLHLVFKLARYLDLHIEELLFGRLVTKHETSESLHSTFFVDKGTKYLLTIKKMHH